LQITRYFKLDLVKHNCSQSIVCGQSIIFLKHELLFNVIFMKSSFRMCADFRSEKRRFQKTLFSEEFCLYSYLKVYTQVVIKPTASLDTSLIYAGLETAV